MGWVMGAQIVSASASRSSAARTFTVVSKNREFQVVDLPPAGPSRGDVRAGRGLLYNEQETQQIGRLDLFCIVTDLTGKSARQMLWTECVQTFSLAGGELEGLTVSTRPTLSSGPTDDVGAIVGGTGVYQTARGQAHYVQQADKVTITISLVS
jgi:hypothetical protein